MTVPTHYQNMLEELAKSKPHIDYRDKEREKYSHIPGEMFLLAPAVHFEDYYSELKAKNFPDDRMLIGRVEDGLPLQINLNNPIRGRVLHIMSDSWLRTRDFVFSIARGIDVQYKPFAKPTDPAVTPRVTYAVVNYWPLDWEWMEEQKGHGGRIPLISAVKEPGQVVKSFVENLIAGWKSKKQTGIFFLLT